MPPRVPVLMVGGGIWLAELEDGSKGIDGLLSGFPESHSRFCILSELPFRAGLPARTKQAYLVQFATSILLSRPVDIVLHFFDACLSQTFLVLCLPELFFVGLDILRVPSAMYKMERLMSGARFCAA
jgi:hypothetical protein